jgi:hypothetical protein
MISLRKYLLPRLVIPSNFGLPPVVAWRGTSPSHAERSRPRLNVRPADPLDRARAVFPVIPRRRCAFEGHLAGIGMAPSADVPSSIRQLARALTAINFARFPEPRRDPPAGRHRASLRQCRSDHGNSSKVVFHQTARLRRAS